MAGAVKSFAVAVVLSLAAVSTAGAQDQELKKDLETLKAKVAALEAENPNAAKAGLPVSVSADSAPAVAEESSGIMAGINGWIKDVAMTGFVDVGYIYNFNSPHNSLNGALPTTTGTQAVRAFDKQSNAFYLHMAQLMFDKPVNDKSIVGGRIKLDFGQDADVISSTGSGSGDNFDIAEGYIQVLAPVGKGITFTAGKFATLAGSEVIESKDDVNYSRSLLFTWAIPFSHTGIRAGYSVMEQLDLLIGIVNGWDKLADNNDAKTLEFQAVFKPNGDWKVILNMYYGAEKDRVVSVTPGIPDTRAPGDKRFLIDFVVNGKIEKLVIGFNWDWAMEQDSTTSAGNPDDARWTGAAAYLSYEVCKEYTPTLRIEYFRDSDGVRTGVQQTLFEFTITNQFNVIENVVMRFELRFDKSSEDVFLKNSDLKGSQFTVGFEVIWIIG